MAEPVRPSEVGLRWSQARPRPPQALGAGRPAAPVRPPLYGRRAYGWLWRVWPCPSSSIHSVAMARPQPLGVAVGAVKNGTATLSYCNEVARILISAQEPISRRGDILLRYRGTAGHNRHESRSRTARFLFWAALQHAGVLPPGIPRRAARPACAWQADAAPLTQKP